MPTVSVLNTDAGLSAKTLVNAEDTQTITGAKTFDRDPSAPFVVSANSAVVSNLDADKVDGLDALQWTTFAPTWTNVTVGNGTVTAKYWRVGNAVQFRVSLVFGSTTSVSGSISVNFPVTGAATLGSCTVAHGEAIDATGNNYMLHGRATSTTVFAVLADNGTSLVAANATVPFTWTTSDELHLLGSFEAA